MTVAVRVTVDSRSTEDFIAKLPKNIRESTGEAIFRFATNIKETLQQGATIWDSKRPITKSRKAAAARIRSEKQSEHRSVVWMPTSLIKLDSMSAHFVPIKWGSSIRRWMRREGLNRKGKFPTARITGRSRVLWTKKGDVKYVKDFKSALYVTPHPFIDNSLRRVRRRLTPELRRGIRKAIRRSRRK